jgi:hypothetical protein
MTALFWMFVIEILPPRWGEFFFYLLVGFPLGLGFSFWKHKKNQHKMENIDKARPRRGRPLRVGFQQREISHLNGIWFQPSVPAAERNGHGGTGTILLHSRRESGGCMVCPTQHLHMCVPRS